MLLPRTVTSLARISRRLHRGISANSTSSTTNANHATSSRLPVAEPSRSDYDMLVRSSDGIMNMAEAFTIIRAIEHEYGPLRDFHFVTDVSFDTRYRHFLWVVFKDLSAYDLACSTKPTINVRMPFIDKSRPGGIGLDDLQKLSLLPAAAGASGVKQERSQFETGISEKHRSVVVHLRKPDRFPFMKRGQVPKSFGTNFPHISVPSRSFPSIASIFLKWGGFANFKPLDAEGYARHCAEFDKAVALRSPLYKVSRGAKGSNMRLVLTKWARVYGQGDPSAPAAQTMGSAVAAVEGSPDDMKPRREPPHLLRPQLSRKEMNEMAASVDRKKSKDPPLGTTASSTASDSPAMERENLKAGDEETEAPRVETKEHKREKGVLDRFQNFMGRLW